MAVVTPAQLLLALAEHGSLEKSSTALGLSLGEQTNNVAEYEGLLLGLRRAHELGAREVELRADSELLIRQLQGRYQVKNPTLQRLHAEAVALLRVFAKASLKHIPRAQNAAA